MNPKTTFIVAKGEVSLTNDEFEKEIEKYLDQGFKLHGPPTFILRGDPKYTQYIMGYQALTYTEESYV